MKKLASATGKEKQVELSPIHDFASKLRQPGILERLQDYVRWQVEWRAARTKGTPIEDMFSSLPDQAPLSINLDVTTSCNYACDHCVDFEILNKNIRYDHDKLLESLTNMHAKGLRSVILIGGGEPTVYPQFTDIVRHLKAMGIKIGVVTNGSRLDRILEVADLFEPEDLPHGLAAELSAMQIPGIVITSAQPDTPLAQMQVDDEHNALVTMVSLVVIAQAIEIA